jgi:DnaJ-domain-containing protein 1
MTRKQWAEIKAAADLLGLGERASLAEIKRSYRRLAKKFHPDVQENHSHEPGIMAMHKLTAAYQTLLHYCSEYRFSFIPGEDEQLEGEDWWFERFGQDHVWGKGRTAEEDSEQ